MGLEKTESEECSECGRRIYEPYMDDHVDSPACNIVQNRSKTKGMRVLDSRPRIRLANKLDWVDDQLISDGSDYANEQVYVPDDDYAKLRDEYLVNRSRYLVKWEREVRVGEWFFASCENVITQFYRGVKIDVDENSGIIIKYDRERNNYKRVRKVLTRLRKETEEDGYKTKSVPPKKGDPVFRMDGHRLGHIVSTEESDEIPDEIKAKMVDHKMTG